MRADRKALLSFADKALYARKKAPVLGIPRLFWTMT